MNNLGVFFFGITLLNKFNINRYCSVLINEKLIVSNSFHSSSDSDAQHLNWRPLYSIILAWWLVFCENRSDNSSDGWE